MDTRQVATEYRMAQWTQIIQDRKASGESIKTYCQNRGLSRDSYFNWQRKLRAAACEQLAAMQVQASKTNLIKTGFTEVKLLDNRLAVPLTESPLHGKLSIEVSGVSITADATYPTDQLICLLRELARIC